MRLENEIISTLILLKMNFYERQSRLQKFYKANCYAVFLRLVN